MSKPLISNEVIHALVQHFDEHDLSNRSVPPDVLGRAYEYLIKNFADDAGAKAGEFFTPPEVVDVLVRMLEPRPGDTVYDPTAGSGGMLVHAAEFLREHGHHSTSARYFAQEMNWGNAAIGKINSVLHGLEADIKAGASTITDPQFLDGGRVKQFTLVLANFPFSDKFCSKLENRCCSQRSSHRASHSRPRVSNDNPFSEIAVPHLQRIATSFRSGCARIEHVAQRQGAICSAWYRAIGTTTAA